MISLSPRLAISCANALIILYLAAVHCLSAKANDPAQRTPSTKRVLMIFSEGKELPGVALFEKAFRGEIQKKSKVPVEFFAEHLDASHFSNKELYRIFRDYLAAKYSGEPLDMLMVLLGRDFKLVETLPAEAFPGLPVVFVTASEMDPPTTLARPGVAGIIQRFDPYSTLKLLQRLQPETKRIVVIGGTSEADGRVLAKINQATKSINGVETEFWTNRPTKELLEPASELPDNTALLLSTVILDVSGQTHYISQIAEMLAPVANAPMYSLGGGAIGKGALGGAVGDPETLAVDAAHLALATLEGTPPTTIHARTNVTMMVDWRELKRWGISERRLPQGCVIRFKPATLWDEHKDVISAALLVFFAQAFTIAGLLAQRAHRRRAEREIQRARNELSHVARVSTMGQLATALAHELNQPLGAILRNAEAAEMFLNKGTVDLDELRAIISDIRKDDQRAGGVIDRMRSFLKRRTLEFARLDISELLQETVALAHPDAQARHVHLAVEVTGRLPPVQGDRVQLQQVLLNLILNGMDAMNCCPDADRLVIVKATKLEEGTIRVQVSDCGTGIPKDKTKAMFEPFFTTKPDGMGMGLAISRTIIEAHGGSIQAENNPGKGATVHFTLPAMRI